MVQTLDRRVDAWRDFGGTEWRTAVDVAAFIRSNHRPYVDGGEFLSGPTRRTTLGDGMPWRHG